MKRILVFELNWMGDILFSFPFLKALRKATPDAHITCAVVPRYADLLANVPWIDEVALLSDRTSFTAMIERTKFTLKMRGQGYDSSFFLKPSRTKAIMSALSNIPERIGFAGKAAPLTRVVELPASGTHRLDQILSLLSVWGIKEPEARYEYFVTEEDEGAALEILSSRHEESRRIVAINHGANWEAKKWPPQNFVQLTEKIISVFNDVEIVITGSRKEKKTGSDMAMELNDPRCYSIAGATSLNVLAAVFKKSSLVISADSGPLHLASAVGAATIGLFGPTSPGITGQRGTGRNIIISKYVDCSVPCYEEKCEAGYECMERITPDEVFNAAKEVLAGD